MNTHSEIKLICFDLDDTLIDQNSWFVLNIGLGMKPEEDALFVELYKEGVLTYEMWTALVDNIWKKRGNTSREHITQLLSGYTY